MAELDPTQVQIAAEAFQRMSDNIERLNANMGDMLDRLPQRAEEAARKIRESWADALDPQEMGRLMEEGVDISLSKWEKFWTGMKKGWDNFSKGMGVTGQGMSSVAQGANRLVNGPVAVLQRLGMQNLPFGGLLGLMLFGKMQAAHYAAEGQKVAQQFEKTGAVGAGVANSIGARVRSLSVQLGREVGPELQAIAGTFGEMGHGAETWGRQAQFEVDGVRRGLVEASFALDNLFESAAGTSAKAAGQIVVDSNMALEDSLTLVKDIGLAAGDLGTSFQQMSGSITQATSALRIQGADARDLADTFATIQQGFEAGGMQRQRAAAMAGAGLGGIAQGIAGMDVGMMGFIGERMSGRRGGEQLSGVQAVVEMQRGMRGGPGEQGFFGDTVAELLAVSNEIAQGDERTQEYALQQMGFSVEAAQALTAIQRQGKDQADIARIAAENSGRLATVFKDEALKVSVFEREMKRLRDALARFGAGLMELVMNGFQSLILLGQMIWAKLKVGLFTDIESTPQGAAFMRAATTQGMALARRNDQIFKEMGGALLQGGSAMANLFSAATGMSGVSEKFSAAFGESEAKVGGERRAPRVPPNAINEFVKDRLRMEGGGRMGRIQTEAAFRGAIDAAISEGSMRVQKGKLIQTSPRAKGTIEGVLSNIEGVKYEGQQGGKYILKVSIEEKPRGAGTAEP